MPTRGFRFPCFLLVKEVKCAGSDASPFVSKTAGKPPLQLLAGQIGLSRARTAEFTYQIQLDSNWMWTPLTSYANV